MKPSTDSMTSLLASVISSLIYIGCTAEIQSCEPGYAVLVPCHTPAKDLITNITEVYCPSGCLNKGLTVWGTDIYTESSPICLAAIHAGLASNGGGYVTVEKMPGQSKYVGSTKNALTSLNYDMSVSAFKLSTKVTGTTVLAASSALTQSTDLPDLPAISSTSARPTTNNATTLISKISTSFNASTTVPNVSTTTPTTALSVTTVTNITTTNSTISVSNLSTSLHTSNISTSTNVATTTKLTPTTTSTTSKSTLASNSTSTTVSSARILSVSVSCYTRTLDLIGDPVTVLCPASCDLNPLVFGTDIYAATSDLCAAAIHAGKITKAGGYVTFKRQPEEWYYYGSYQNGINSYDSLFEEESFVLI